MKYFLFNEIIAGAAFFLLLGAAFGILKNPFYALLSSAQKIKFVFLKAYYRFIDRRVGFSNIQSKNKAENKNQIVSDFLYTSFFMLAMLLGFYSFFDGIIRIYAILIALVSFYSVKKYLSARLSFLLSKFTFIPRRILFYILAVILLPIRIILITVGYCAKKASAPIKKIRNRRLSMHLFERKRQNLKLFLKENVIC